MRERFETGGILAFALLLAVSPAAGAQEDLYSRPAVLPVPEDAQVEINQDRTYKRAGGRALGMDVYLPADRNPEARLPTVVFVHGGPVPEDLPEGAKDIAQFTSYGRLVASRGLAAVTFSHRFTSTDMMPGAAEDVADAIRYVREHADELSVDPDRICVWAVSAGPMFTTPLLRERPPYLQCVVLYYGVVDPAALEEVGMEGVPEKFAAEYNATEAVMDSGGSLPRLVVGRAGQDAEPINRALDEFIRAALEANAPLDVMNHPEGRHSFDIDNDDARSQEIIRRTLEIVQAALSEDEP